VIKDLRIKTKLASGFGLIVAIILVLLTIAYVNFSKLSMANQWDRHTLEVLLEVNHIENALLQVQTSTRGFMLTGEESVATPVAAQEAAAYQHLQQVRRLTGDNASQQERLSRLEPMMRDWIDHVIEPLLIKRRLANQTVGTSMQVATMGDIVNGAKTMADMRGLIAEMAAEENHLLAARSAALQDLRQLMVLVLTVGGVACVVLAALIGYVLSRALLLPLNELTDAVGRIAAGRQGARARVLARDELGQVALEFNRMAQAIEDNQANELAATNLLKSKVDTLLEVVSKAASGDLTGKIAISGDDAVGQLGRGLARMFDNLRSLVINVQKAGIQVTTSATEIAASAREQEATGIEQAQTSVEILSTTKEISANTAQLLKTMEDATAVADYTTSATADAQNNLRRMDSTMQHMVAATDSINAKLAALSEKASNINSVLITITKVADQTNILSLNAAIEAEKAGEAGRGFSVVATEIRRLADQTSVSTWDIEQMLKEMQSAVSASVMGMDKFSEEIRRSVGEVRQVTEQLSGVMTQVQKLAPQFDVVLQGMQSQAIGASQISDTMMQLSDATQQTVETLRATSEAVHQLQYAAGDLQAGVANFALNT